MDDSRIVELYWNRSEEAIYQTDVKYGRYCYSIANNILTNREDAEECVSDTYFAAWEAIPPTRPSVLSTFLGKIIRRISIDRWRARSASKRGGGEMSLALDELAECIPGGNDPAAEVEAKELAAAVARFLDMLPCAERKVFLMRYFELARLQDIADRFSMRVSKVKSMLHRTRGKLRVHLQKEGY